PAGERGLEAKECEDGECKSSFCDEGSHCRGGGGRYRRPRWHSRGQGAGVPQTVAPGGGAEDSPEVPLPLLPGARRRPEACPVRVRPRPRTGPPGPPPTPGPRPGARRAGDRTPPRRDRGEPVLVPRDVAAVHGCPRGRGAEVADVSEGRTRI